MDWNLNLSIDSPVPLVGILGAALVAAGIVTYRGSARTWVRAFAAAMVAAGVVAWALILLITPVSVTRGPAPGVISSASSAGPNAISSERSATVGAMPSASTTAHAATPTVVPTVTVPVGWKLYRSEDFEFSYPTACSVTQRDGSMTVGGRIELAVADAGGLTLRDYVTRFVDERTRMSGWKVDSQQVVTLGANQGIRVDYRFGGTNRFGTAVFLEGRGQVHTWGLTAGSFTCDEPAAFDGIVSSFRFTR